MNKTFRLRSEAYMAHVRTFPCLVCGDVSEAHHLLRTPDGRGMGMKSGDQWCVPLCHEHHMELHNLGAEPLYFTLKGVEDPVTWARCCYAAWEMLHGE
jgi:hypothetical protein